MYLSHTKALPVSRAQAAGLDRDYQGMPCHAMPCRIGCDDLAQNTEKNSMWVKVDTAAVRARVPFCWAFAQLGVCTGMGLGWSVYHTSASSALFLSFDPSLAYTPLSLRSFYLIARLLLASLVLGARFAVRGSRSFGVDLRFRRFFGGEGERGVAVLPRCCRAELRVWLWVWVSVSVSVWMGMGKGMGMGTEGIWSVVDWESPRLHLHLRRLIVH